MLQNEFEELIGRKATTEEYCEANAMYMAAGEMDKAEFCQEWKKVGTSRLVKELNDRVYRLQEANHELKLIREEQQRDLSSAADVMIETAAQCGEGTLADDLTKAAENLVGVKEVVLRKIAMGIHLSDGEMAYLREKLNGNL